MTYKEEKIPNFTEPIFENVPIEDIQEDEDGDFEPRETLGANFYKKVSCAVTADTDVSSVLIELAKQAGVCIGICPDVKANASLVADNKPFISVVNDICDMCKLRYSISGNSIKIENDQPYLKTYNVQFLNISRETNAEIVTANAMSSLNSALDSKSAARDNGSSSSVKDNGKTDFWNELEANLKIILSADKKSTGDTVTIHRQGGIITVIATEKQHKFIDQYIKLLKKTTQSQVLIEAKILEVGLLDQFKSGIDWSSIQNNQVHLNINPMENLSNNSSFTALSLGYNGTNFQSILKCIEKYGKIRTLSNPRITVMNNQSAVMKIAKNEIITKPSLYRQFASNNDARNTDAISVDIQTIPIGIIFTVHPSIDINRREITLTIRPTLSRVVEQRSVEVYSYTSGNGRTGVTATPQKMNIPIVEVRELDSILKLKSGQVVVMGGIMQEISKYSRAGIPHTKDIPLLNFACNGREKDNLVSELVVFLRARIISNKKRHVIHQKDTEHLKNYAHDSRPFFKEQIR